MKKALTVILSIFFFAILNTFEGFTIYAANESGLSQNCGIYGQTDMFTKEQIQELNAVVLRSSKEINLNIVFYLTDKDLTGREAGSIYYETVGATEGLIYLMDVSENRQMGDSMIFYGRAETYYNGQFEMFSSELLEILPNDQYTSDSKYRSAIGEICVLLEDYAGFPKFHHPRYIVENMGTFDPIGWIEAIPSTIGFFVSLIVLFLMIAEVFYFTFDIENPFIGIIVGITVSSIVNTLVWLVIASIWGLLLWVLEHFIILGCYLYNCSIDNHNKNLVLADSGMERIFLEDFSLLSKVLILAGVVLLVIAVVKIVKKICHPLSGETAS